MQNRFLLHKGVTVRPGHDVLPPSVTDEEYRELMAGEDRYLMTEANTLAELEATFFYDDPVHWQSGQMLEAITSSRLQLSRTMKAFIRALNQKLTGTGLQAGSNSSGGPVQDGATEIGGADIGRARNINGLPVLPAIIPLSDGQTVSILFHSPTADGKITSNDTLVAFQFLLNKKDVTHTVAPMKGQDMTLAQVTMKLANLAEKNSGKFQKAQKKQKALTDEINQLQADSDQKEDAMSDVSDQSETITSQAADLEQQVNAAAGLADTVEAENEQIQIQIDALTKSGGQSSGVPATQITSQPKVVADRLAAVKQNMHIDGQATLSNGAVMKQFIRDGEGYVTLTDTDGTEYQIQAESMQGGKLDAATGTLFKAYRAGKADAYKLALPEPAPEPAIDPQPAPVAATEPDLEGAAGNGQGGYVSVKPTQELAQAIAKRVSDLGISGGIEADKLHVTLMYSKTKAINALPEPDRVYEATLNGHFEIMGEAPWRALVVHLDSPDLQNRFAELSEAGGEHSYPEFKAHLSLKYDAQEADLEQIQQEGLGITSIKLTGETFKPIDIEAPQVKAEPEQAPQPTPNVQEMTDPSIFWYGMRLRAGGPNDPEYQGVGIISLEEAQTLPVFTGKGFSADDIRHGAIGYRVELPAAVVADYELVDLRRGETATSAVETLTAAIRNAASKWAGDAKTFARLLVTGDQEVYVNIEGYDKASIVALMKKAGYLGGKTGADEFYSLVDGMKASAPVSEAAPASEAAPEEITLPDGKTLSVEYHADVDGYAYLITQNGQRIGITVDNLTRIRNAIGGSDEHSDVMSLNQLNAALGKIEQENANSEDPVVDEDKSVSEADQEAQRAIDFLKGIGSFTSTDLDEINGQIVKVQEAAQALTDAGVYEENEGLVNDSADHLIGLLVAVQQAGAD